MAITDLRVDDDLVAGPTTSARTCEVLSCFSSALHWSAASTMAASRWASRRQRRVEWELTARSTWPTLRPWPSTPAAGGARAHLHQEPHRRRGPRRRNGARSAPQHAAEPTTRGLGARDRVAVPRGGHRQRARAGALRQARLRGAPASARFAAARAGARGGSRCAHAPLIHARRPLLLRKRLAPAARATAAAPLAADAMLGPLPFRSDLVRAVQGRAQRATAALRHLRGARRSSGRSRCFRQVCVLDPPWGVGS